MTIRDNLREIRETKIKDNNPVSCYLTFRQRPSNKSYTPDYMTIAGSLISAAWRKKLDENIGLAQYVDACMYRLSNKIGNTDFEMLLSQMYFDEDAKGLYQISPEFLLFKAWGASAGNTKLTSEVLGTILTNSEIEIHQLSQDVNFLESELLDELKNHIVDFESSSRVVDYLPFLSNAFVRDFALLSQHPSYMMQNFQSFITLYNFLYSSQLAKNIRDWQKKPCSKPLYFILDTERSSIERTRVREAVGALYDNLEYLFPILSILEYFNKPYSKCSIKYPLWAHFNYIDSLSDSERLKVVSDLRVFVDSYRDMRDLDICDVKENSLIDVFDLIVRSARELFTKPRSGHLDVNKKTIKVFKEEVARHFIQNRNRGGRVIILNQDYLLLLTNLAIGNAPDGKLPLQILLEEFKSRGVWLDQQSQQALIEFYERVGNLERMSDSGDAVYVRKTI